MSTRERAATPIECPRRAPPADRLLLACRSARPCRWRRGRSQATADSRPQPAARRTPQRINDIYWFISASRRRSSCSSRARSSSSSSATAAAVARARPRAPQVHGADQARADLDGRAGADPRRDRRLRLLQAARDQGRPDRDAPATRSTVRSRAHQFYWQFDYPNGADLDRRDARAGRQGRAARGHGAGRRPQLVDPELGGKIDAIPGKTNTPGSRPTEPGRTTGQCAEFCGLFHAAMTADVVVVSPGGLRELPRRARGRASADVGKETFTASARSATAASARAATARRSRATRLLADRKALEHDRPQRARARCRRSASDWTDAQMDALLALPEGDGSGASGG